MKRFFCPFLSVLILILSLSACGAAEAAYRTDLRADALMRTVTDALPTADGYVPVEDGFITPSAFGTDCQALLDATEERIICISGKSDANIDEIGILRVKNTADPAAVAAIARAYLTAQKLRYRDLLKSYNPAELPKSEGGQVLVCGRYVLYTLLGDSETATAQRTFQDALKMCSCQ